MENTVGDLIKRLQQEPEDAHVFNRRDGAHFEIRTRWDDGSEHVLLFWDDESLYITVDISPENVRYYDWALTEEQIKELHSNPDAVIYKPETGKTTKVNAWQRLKILFNRRLK